MTNYKTALGALYKYAKKKGKPLELYSVATGECQPIAYWFSNPVIEDTKSRLCEPHYNSGLYFNGQKVLTTQSQDFN